MLTISDKNIILGSIGGGGGSAPVLPDGWDGGWMFPPTYDATSINGKTDICGIVCNVLDIGDRNYFSCLATGDYTVNVYTDATATTLISTQNVATNTQANWQIDYAACTHQLDSETRQAWVEVVPQSGQSLISVSLNTNHPAETNTNSNAAYRYAILRLPSALTLSSFAQSQRGVKGVDVYAPLVTNVSSALAFSAVNTIDLSLPSASVATALIQSALALQSAYIDFGTAKVSMSNLALACAGLQSLTIVAPNGSAATTAFGNGAQVNSCQSLRKLLLNGLRVGFVLQWTAMQAPELNALFASLGTASGAQTIDVRNNPGSATCDTSIATAKGYTVLTA